MAREEATPEERQEILKYIKPIASNNVCKVIIIEKQWYDQLLNWLNSPSNHKPGKMEFRHLMKGTHLRNDIVYGVDFEAIPTSTFNHIKQFFESIPCYERNLILDPKTKKPIIMFRSVTVHIRYKTTKFRKEALRDWTIGDVKKQLCEALNLDPQDHILRSDNDGSLVDETLTVQRTLESIPGALHLSKAESASKKVRPAPLIIPESDDAPKSPKSRSPKRKLASPRREQKHDDLGFPKPVFPDTPTEEPAPATPFSPSKQLPSPWIKSAKRAKDPGSFSVIDHVMLNATTPFPKPAGLTNLGNTCFFNAAVQCLARIQPLTAFILSPAFDRQLNTKNPQGSKGLIACAYRDFLRDLCSGTSKTRNPTKLRDAVISKYRRFANYGQHDAQELLCALLDGLHEDMNQSCAAGGRVASPVKADHRMDSWQLHNAKNSSPIQDLFHGKLFSSIECPECTIAHSVHDPFTFLSLAIPRTRGPVQLADCLQQFSQCETLDAKNKWRCSCCGKLVCATKRMGVDHCAPVLIIHLKRFSGYSFLSTKVETPVDYPNILETGTFCSSQKKSKYKLVAAVFHNGGLGGGHYVAAAFDSPSQKWYNFNDAVATPIAPAGAHSSKAYILFYQLCV